jgi:hypothetical protein
MTLSLVPPTGFVWRGSLPARLATALPDLGVGVGFLITWIAPLTFGPKAVSYFMLVMLLEFLIVHSAGFMGSVVFNKPLARRIKVRTLVGLGAFYALFAAGFAAGFQAWWPLWTIAVLTLNRILIVLLGYVPEGRERAVIRKGWVVATLFYVLFAFATTLLPVPAFGITDAVVHLQAFTSSGLGIDEPQRVLAFGFLYFIGTGLSELFSHQWLPDGHLPQDQPLPETA